VLLLPQGKKLASFVGPGLVAGGFWYLKNLVWFSNPFYPLYLGHPGVTKAEYAGLMAAIQQFGPKTWAYFWQLLGYFREIPRLPIYLALFLAPCSILIKRGAAFTRLLLLYFLLYVPYWFFLGTHQMRFFAPAAMAALLLAAIVIGRLSARWLIVGYVAITIWMWSTPYFDQDVASFFWSTKFHLTERQYALGHLTQDEFMYRSYGCYYSMVKYINTLPPGVVVDNWSYGIEFNIPFYSQNHAYIQWTNPDLIAMNEAGVKYLYIRDKDVAAYRARGESSFSLAIPTYTALDNFFESQATPLKQIDDCRLYELTK
jgi:hypothetical protein